MTAFRWGFRCFNRFFHMHGLFNFSFFRFFLFNRFGVIIDFNGLFLNKYFG